MTRYFLEEFAERKLEVKRYLLILMRVEKDASSGLRRQLKDRRINVLKAGAFLVLYNLVEASARAAVEAIHDEILRSQAKFEDLSTDLRREVIKGFKKRADSDRHKDLKNLDIAVVKESLSVEMMFSGNVDSKLIRRFGKIYGFDTDTPPKARDGADLLPIKANRNDLAHGLKSFEAIGREHPTRELLATAIRAMAYIAAILKNVDLYLDRSGYLLSTQTPPPP